MTSAEVFICESF